MRVRFNLLLVAALQTTSSPASDTLRLCSSASIPGTHNEQVIRRMSWPKPIGTLLRTDPARKIPEKGMRSQIDSGSNHIHRKSSVKLQLLSCHRFV